jgi:hypothetical protein
VLWHKLKVIIKFGIFLVLNYTFVLRSVWWKALCTTEKCFVKSAIYDIKLHLLFMAHTVMKTKHELLVKEKNRFRLNMVILLVNLVQKVKSMVWEQEKNSHY